MKRQIIALVFAACFVSNFALADSPTDAPLMPTIQSPAAPQEKDGKRHQRNKAAEVASQNPKNEKVTTKSDNCPKANQPAAQTADPADANSSSAL